MTLAGLLATSAASHLPSTELAGMTSPHGADGGSPLYLEAPWQPGTLAHSIPDSAAADQTHRIAELSSSDVFPALNMPEVHGVPESVLAAYRRAAGRLREEQPSCGVSVPLLAGIGRVESNHARGGDVDADGRARNPIIGLQLNGGPDVALIRDTDGGRYDGDPSYDRAVGPMQFIPSTWARWGADGDGDGVSDPQNIYDSTLAAGRYLCATGGDLTTPEGVNRAVLAYNPSTHYLNVVLSWVRVYSGGTMAISDGYSAFPGSGDIRAISYPDWSDETANGGASTGSSKGSSEEGKSKTGAKKPAAPENESGSGAPDNGNSGSAKPAPEPQPEPRPDPGDGNENPPPEGGGNEPPENGPVEEAAEPVEEAAEPVKEAAEPVQEATEPVQGAVGEAEEEAPVEEEPLNDAADEL